MAKSLIMNVRIFLCILIFFILIKSNLTLATTYERLDYKNTVNVSQWSVVSDTNLDKLRGGFVLPNGLIVNISFDKRILQNGDEIFHSFFQLPENINLTTNDEFDTSPLLDNNTIQSIVQNHLDNQNISSISLINIDIKNFNNATQSFNSFNSIDFYTQFVLPNTRQ